MEEYCTACWVEKDEKFLGLFVKVVASIIAIVVGGFALFIGSFPLIMFMDEHLKRLDSREQSGAALTLLQKVKRLLFGLVKVLIPLKAVPAVRLERETLSFSFDVPLDTKEWFNWLSRFYNRGFYVIEPGVYDAVEIFDAHQNSQGVWIAVATIRERKHRFEIGPTNKLTTARLLEIVDQCDALWRR